MIIAKTKVHSAPRSYRGAGLRSATHDLHIRVIECDPRISNHLELAASALAVEARRTDDLRLARIMLEACARVTVLARVHERLRTLDLENQVELARLVPELCEELRTCLDDAAGSAPDGGAAIDWIAGELLETVVAEDAHHGGACVRLEHDEDGARRLTVADGEGERQGAGLRLLRAFAARFGGSLQSAPLPRGTTISVLFD